MRVLGLGFESKSSIFVAFCLKPEPRKYTPPGRTVLERGPSLRCANAMRSVLGLTGPFRLRGPPCRSCMYAEN